MKHPAVLAQEAAAIAAETPDKKLTANVRFIIRTKDMPRVHAIASTLRKTRKVTFTIAPEGGIFNCALATTVSGPAHLVSYYLTNMVAIAKN